MRPGLWQPPVACSRLEREVIKRIKRAKLFVWLREHRHELFDEDLQAELAQMYADRPVGQPPVPPAQLALATILQAYTGASDDEVLEAMVMDRRWQLVLGVLGGRQGWGLAAAERARVLADQAGIGVLAGPSLKAALDLDWDDPAAHQRALGVVLAALGRVEQLVGALPGGDDPCVVDALAAAHQVCDQDVTVDPDGVPRIRQGVARDRRISIADPQMRHGRKTRSRRVDGYKRHVLHDLDSELVRAVGLTPANLPEAEVAAQVQDDLTAQGVQLGELHIDRAYLASSLVRDRAEDLQVFCKAFPVRAPGGRFAKPAFTIDFARHTLTCPNSVVMPFTPSGKVQFPAQTCRACPLRERCTTSPRGRSVQIHPDERLLVELRTRQQTSPGRARLRERVHVEHALAHVGRWQGDRARYLGLRKNLFDLRRVAVVHNLHVIARQPHQTQQAA